MSKLTLVSHPPELADAEIANQFIKAIDEVARIMTEADKQGLNCGFEGIRKKANNQYEAVNPFVNKRIV